MTSGEYKDISVNELLGKINHTILLPEIQREYVWNPEDVEKLFESIVDGYPIGSCIFWKTTENIIKKSHLNLYYFINKCKRENSRAPRDAITNEKVDGFVTVDDDYYIVLDGQQRITSLYIALMGCFHIKKRYTHDKYEERKLYYNLASYDSELDEEQPVRKFCFLTPSAAKADAYYPVKNVPSFSDSDSLINDVKVYTGRQHLNPQAVKDLKTLFRRLVSKSHRDNIIHYYCIDQEDYDKALDIFVRINSTGKKLSKSDLLFSTLIDGWQEGRKTITDTIEQMNKKGDSFIFNFTRDYLMRAALVLVDANTSLKIGSLTSKKVDPQTNESKTTVELIRDEWPKINQAMDKMTNLLVDIGMYDERMTSYNASMPLVYYYYIGGEFKTEESKQEARKFLAIAMAKGLFGVASNSALTETRNALKGIDCTKTPFSVSLFKDVVLTGNRTFTVSETEIENWIDTFEKGNNTYVLLTLLYPHLKLNQNSFHQDHCHPYSAFEKRGDVSKLGLDSDTLNEWRKMRNRLPNLQFLEGRENESKNDTALKKWITDGNDFAYHPDNISLELKDFVTFYNERRKLVLNELKTIFDLA